jgi:hypothetical protein
MTNHLSPGQQAYIDAVRDVIPEADVEFTQHDDISMTTCRVTVPFSYEIQMGSTLFFDYEAGATATSGKISAEIYLNHLPKQVVEFLARREL